VSDYYGVTPEEIDKTVVFSTDITLYKPETEEEKSFTICMIWHLLLMQMVVDEEEKELIEKYAVRFDVSL
jgi:hypothetical protein